MDQAQVKAVKPVVQFIERLQQTGGLKGNRHREFYRRLQSDRIPLDDRPEVASSQYTTHHLRFGLRGDAAQRVL